MPRTVRLRELLIGVEGLALLRHLYDGSDEAAERRLAEVRRVLEEDGFADGQTIEEASPDVCFEAEDAGDGPFPIARAARPSPTAIAPNAAAATPCAAAPG